MSRQSELRFNRHLGLTVTCTVVLVVLLIANRPEPLLIPAIPLLVSIGFLLMDRNKNRRA
jgi:hypothetical protein